jgi:hypothetical protein
LLLRDHSFVFPSHWIKHKSDLLSSTSWLIPCTFHSLPSQYVTFHLHGSTPCWPGNGNGPSPRSKPEAYLCNAEE